MKKAIQTISIIALALALSCADSFAAEQPKKVLVCDETTIQTGEKDFKVNTTNEKVFQLLMSKYEAKAKRYHVNYKTDRLGRYKDITIFFALEDKQAIETFLKGL